MTRPVVLIAEELSPATVEALGPDFEIRHCDGSDRAELLAALPGVDALLVRSATKVDAEALAVAKSAEGRRTGRRRARQRRRQGRDPRRRHGRQRADVEHRQRRELAVALLLACARNIAPASAALKSGKWKRSQVHRRRAHRQGRRHRRPRTHRAARGAATVRVRGHARRVRPVRAARARGPARDPDGRARRAARRGGLHHGAPAEDPGDRRADRRGGAAQGQAHGADRQRGPRRDHRRARAVRGAQGRPGRRRRDRRVEQRTLHRLTAVRVRAGRRDTAPGRLDRRGAGEGRRRGGALGPPRAGR